MNTTVSLPGILYQDILEAAHAYIDNQEYGQAGVLLNLVQQHCPEQPDCLHAMGVIALHTNQPQISHELLQRAILALFRLPQQAGLEPTKARFLAHLGQAEQACGHIAAAIIAWMRSLALEPNPIVADWLSAGKILAEKKGQEIDAYIIKQEKIRDALFAKQKFKSSAKKSKKKNQSNQLLNGEISKKLDELLRLGGFERASELMPLCQELQQRYPELSDTAHWLGICLLYQRQAAEALAWVVKATELAPWHPFLFNTRAVLERRSGTPEEVIASFRKALQLKPNYAEAHQNLANSLREAGEYEEATGWYQRALELKPDYAECWNNLGILHKEMKQMEKAQSCFEKAISLRSDYPNPYMCMGIIAEERKDRQKAVQNYRTALKINPLAHEIWLSLIHNQMHLCDWQDLEASILTVRNLVSSNYPGELLPFNFISLPGTTATEQHACAKKYAKNRFAPFIRQAKSLNFTYAIKEQQPLRIGYLSADYRQHAVAVSLVQILELHNPEKFEVFAYSYCPDDGSEVRKRIAACTKFVDLQAYSFIDAAKYIYNDHIDILIDLTGYTANGRTEICAMRPAPIQVNYLGYPCSMGVPFIDYLIGDATITPLEQADCFSEKLAILPNCYFPNDQNRKMNSGFSRNQEGLPEDAFVFCSFNQPYKINPQLWEIWCNLLRNAPNSVLWLHSFENIAKERLQAKAAKAGLDPQRIYFANIKPDLADHLGRLALADLALDTIPYNGHTTTGDALWAGVPVLTCLGETFSSRVAASLLRTANLPELITNSLDEYQAKALSLTQNISELQALRQKLAVNKLNAPLHDTLSMTRNLEKLYTLMYDNWKQAKLPQHIVLDM